MPLFQKLKTIHFPLEIILCKDDFKEFFPNWFLLFLLQSLTKITMPVQRKGMRALQIWVSRVTSNYSSIEITDLTTSFRNGLAFVGIIHHFKPDLITNPDKLDPEDIIGNNDLAYKVAEEKLQIPSLLDSEDMLASEEPDKFSIVTYLAQFYHLFKNEDKNVSPNVSLHLSSESESETPLGTPTSNKKTFDKNDLIEKYGEEIFKKTPVKKVSTEEEDEGVVVTMTRPKRRVVGGVASMCKDFERKARFEK